MYKVVDDISRDYSMLCKFHIGQAGDKFNVNR